MLDVRAALKSLFGREPAVVFDPCALLIEGRLVGGYCVEEQVGDLIFRGFGPSEVHALWDLLFSVTLAAVTTSTDGRPKPALPDVLELFE